MKYTPTWTIIYASEHMLSTSSCLLAAWSLNRSIKILNSCVCLATFMFFTFKGLYSLFRTAFYLSIIHAYLSPEAQKWIVIDEANDIAALFLFGNDVKSDGVLVKPSIKIAAVLIFGDVFNFASILWMFFSVKELLKLASGSIDRGLDLEQKICKIYVYSLCGVVFFYAISYIVFLSMVDAAPYRTHSFGLIAITARSSTMLLSLYAVLYLRYQGRSLELVHGRFIRAPLYARLQRIVYV